MQAKVKRKIFVIVGYFFVSVGVIAILSFFVKIVRMPAWLSFIGLLSLGFYLLFQVLCFLGRLKINKKLKAMSLEELERETFSFLTLYFIEISDDPAVVRFKELILKKDLSNLMKEWPTLDDRIKERLNMLPRDRRRGHGYPYSGYELYLKALAERYTSINKCDPLQDEESP